MRVRQVQVPGTPAASFTVVDDRHRRVPAVDAYLGALTRMGRSPNTVRAYAQDLRDLFEYLAVRRLPWDRVDVEALGHWCGWLALPPAVRRHPDGVLALHLPRQCSDATIVRKLAAVTGFYRYHLQRGVPVHAALWGAAVDSQATGSGYRRMLAHLGDRGVGRTIGPRSRRSRPVVRILSPRQMQALLDACRTLRDRFLLALLYDTGLRIGEALGARHADFEERDAEFRVVFRADNLNGARVKSLERVIPASDELVRLGIRYLTEEYGSIDSDYLFVNLTRGTRGQPLRYGAVADLVTRVRATVGFCWTPHEVRHTYACRALEAGLGMEALSELLGHRDQQTTQRHYGHFTKESLRTALVTAGHLNSTEVQLCPL